jgi:hypothetical protein
MRNVPEWVVLSDELANWYDCHKQDELRPTAI